MLRQVDRLTASLLGRGHARRCDERADHDPRHRRRPRQHRAHRAHDRPLRRRASSTGSTPRPSSAPPSAAAQRVATYAKRWAAKEACSKALGTGLRMGIAWKDMGGAQPPRRPAVHARDRLGGRPARRADPAGDARDHPRHPDRRPPLGAGVRGDRGASRSTSRRCCCPTPRTTARAPDRVPHRRSARRRPDGRRRPDPGAASTSRRLRRGSRGALDRAPVAPSSRPRGRAFGRSRTRRGKTGATTRGVSACPARMFGRAA